ncbi:MAG: GNAT family N-acetyltransferase [Pseudomonadota bacterium]
MTLAITLAAPPDAPRLLPLIEAFHSEYGLSSTPESRDAALMPLLEGSPLGAVWLFGPTKAPTGYTIITFGWSMEFGGMDAFVDELYIRPAVRQRGLASEALRAIASSLADVGVTALHLEVDRADEATQRLYTRARFELRDRYALMSRRLT